MVVFWGAFGDPKSKAKSYEFLLHFRFDFRSQKDPRKGLQNRGLEHQDPPLEHQDPPLDPPGAHPGPQGPDLGPEGPDRDPNGCIFGPQMDPKMTLRAYIFGLGKLLAPLWILLAPTLAPMAPTLAPKAPIVTQMAAFWDPKWTPK